MIFPRHWPWLLLFAGVGACGQTDGFTIAVRVTTVVNQTDALRRFPPNTPEPDRLQVKILRLTGLNDQPLIDLDQAWTDLVEDPVTTRKYLLIDVPANAGKDDPYVLQLSSQVGETIDECGAVGPIVADRGQKVSVDVAPHPGDCQARLCAGDDDCAEGGFCLSFECREAIGCSLDSDCPSGASCQQDACGATCEIDSDCPTSTDGQPFTCCIGFCAAACFHPRIQ